MSDIWSNLPVAFYFSVNIENISFPFKEVSGLNVEMELETVDEGGLNTYQHQLPKQIRHGNLALKPSNFPIPLFNDFEQWQ